jgi:hypothetical protein
LQLNFKIEVHYATNIFFFTLCHIAVLCRESSNPLDSTSSRISNYTSVFFTANANLFKNLNMRILLKWKNKPNPALVWSSYLCPMNQCCGSGDVLSRIRIWPLSHPGCGSKYLFIPDPGSSIYMKSEMQTYLFLASYAFRSKVLVLVIVKMIRDPRSGIRKKFILDPDPGSRTRGYKSTGSLIRIFNTGYDTIKRSQHSHKTFSLTK